MDKQRISGLAVMLSGALALASCGGGGGGSNSVAPPPPPSGDNAQRVAAATATANGNPDCSASSLNSYYWEIGDVNGTLASGHVGPGSENADTMMNIASASKWPFAAYVIEKNGDVPANVPYLHFTSGYSNFSNNNVDCPATVTVGQCNNGTVNAAEAAAQTFHYEGGHMQQLAVNLSLGSIDANGLANEVNSQIGSDVGVSFVKPLPEGGVRTTPRHYAIFLRKLLAGSPSPLKLGAMLGSHAVCTQPGASCNASTETAAALKENFHYSLGHWVEDDAAFTPSSNFAYSSAGKFGFYPWVDFDRTLYGIVAREDSTATFEGTGEGHDSLKCGRLLRLAWKAGVAQ